ncbi:MULTISPECIES: putative Se/S carrier-like protein [Acutalibacteraceae]|uniref:putative Se/S carrier-like protein n=1 Tax=Acutalibacteraceae TaxID=3082771 RepID=UPI001FAA12D5|nr:MULTISPECIES: putative Se/S carrier-like protein [Acutalibacteraceae]
MGKPLILVGSITNAIKSRNILVRLGIRSYVERIPGSYANGGCGYCIFVPGGRADEAEDILLRYGVPVNGRAEREDTI